MDKLGLRNVGLMTAAVLLGIPSTVTIAQSLPINANFGTHRSVRSLGPLHRVVRMSSQQTATVVGPPTCMVTSPTHFIGEPGIKNEGAYELNYADQYSGVVAGHYNEACGTSAGILAGQDNILNHVPGGNYGTYDSVVVGGDNNDIGESGYAFIGGGSQNLIGMAPPYGTGGLSSIVSGFANTIGSPSDIIGAGEQNTLVAASTAENPQGGQDSIIGAGYSNSVSSFSSGILAGRNNYTSADYSTVVSGFGNTVSGQYAAVVAGNGNTAQGLQAFVGGGISNNASGQDAMISGGYGNSVAGSVATIGGGFSNTASGQNATIPGGANNIASGLDSFAAGKGSQALNTGSFVWSDDATNAITLKSTASNQLLARASGGVYLYSSANLTSGVRLAPGSGSWSSLSDRAAKTDIQLVDAARILAKVAAMPVSEWSYIDQGNKIRHVGPMAQDFRASFGLGEDEKHIASVDEEGIALAAIKALQVDLVDSNRKLTRVVNRYGNLESRYEVLEKRLDVIQAKMNTSK